MKVLYSLILFLISFSLCSTAHAQFNDQEKEFLTFFINDVRKQKDTVYFIIKHDDKALKQALKPDTLSDIPLNFSYDIKLRNNIVVLTRNERKYIEEELGRHKELKSDELVLPNARLLTSDEVENFNKSSLNQVGIKKFSEYYKISRPVFLRKGTLCIFQYDFDCGFRCGLGKTLIYKKVKGKWELFLNVGFWIE